MLILLAMLFSTNDSALFPSFPGVQPLPDHALWTSELKKFVSSDGKVDYAAWKNNQGSLDAYLAQATAVQPVTNWSRNVQLSYWINLYNAFTVKLILEHYPVRSIKDIDQGNPWDTGLIHIGAKTYSLNQIENGIIRQQFRDPRVHFALNCGARSCPKLLNEAYDPARLDAQLTARTLSFISDPSFNRTGISPIQISQLFDWYKADFLPDVISFLNKYTETQVSADAKIEYLEYDWGLNEK